MRESQMQLEEEEKRALIQGHYLQQRATQQNMQLQAIKIADAMKTQDDQVHAEAALSTFSDRIRRAKILGPNDPTAQAGVIDWAQQYRGLLTTPGGKALWEDYLNSVEEDRKHAMQIDTLKQGVDERAAIAAAQMQMRDQQAIDMETFRQQNRVALENMREKARNEIRVQPGITEDQWVNRHLNMFVGPMQFDETIQKRGEKFGAAEQMLREAYRGAHSGTTAPSAISPAPASSPAKGATGRINPLPSEKAALEAGKLYDTPKGVLRWNGAVFEKAQ
jgi:hypothetical protein